ncbi:10848_t:CDS:2 [Ambispora leptoticha]|uniref:10848_t:CDS:1 n=1 Tax=Ambispora leptoticha TaxID=144679 RepID=A0A9N8VPC3_9GLOM|nr:10848_t:CDS:2 [Ambispora leptoticha]
MASPGLGSYSFQIGPSQLGLVDHSVNLILVGNKNLADWSKNLETIRWQEPES